MSETKRILVMEDDRDIAEIVSATAHRLNMDCTLAEDVAGFLKALDDEPAVIVMDIRMTEMGGLELLGVLGERGSKAKVVLMSGLGRVEMQQAKELGESAGLTMIEPLIKPFRVAELMTALSS